MMKSSRQSIEEYIISKYQDICTDPNMLQVLVNLYEIAVMKEKARCAKIVRDFGQTTTHTESLALFYRIETEIRIGS